MDLIHLSREKGFISRDNLIMVNANYKFLWLCELQKWLRETKDINIEIYCHKEKNNILWNWSGYYIKIQGLFTKGSNYHNTYEEALEEALLYYLNNI